MTTNRKKREILHFTNLGHIWWGLKTPAGQRRYDNKFSLFKKKVKIKKNFRALEIGCGDGEFTKRISKLPLKIIATDITPAVIKRARKYFAEKNVTNIRFGIENAEKLSFKDNYFDLVCGISILHHLNYKKTLKETFRVLKNGGEIFFTEPNLLNPVILMGLNIPFFRKKMEFSPDETALLRWDIENVLKDIGFAKVNVSNYDFLFPHTPPGIIKYVEKVGRLLERIPVIKEISGSLCIYAQK